MEPLERVFRAAAQDKEYWNNHVKDPAIRVMAPAGTDSGRDPHVTPLGSRSTGKPLRTSRGHAEPSLAQGGRAPRTRRGAGRQTVDPFSAALFFVLCQER